MLFIFRTLMVLVLIALAAASLFPAAIVAIDRMDLALDLSSLSPELAALAAGATWLEAALWFAAGLLFLIASVRLVRRTEGFWVWLIGFALYSSRWAVTVEDQSGLMKSLQSVTPESFTPDQITSASPAAQLIILGAHLAVGLIILAIDVADRRYWDSHGA